MPNLFKYVGLCLFSLYASSGFAQPRLQLLKGVPQIEIPFEYVNHFIIVEVYLNAVYPYRLIFDTGAEHTILTRKDFMSWPGMTFERTFYLIGSDQEKVIPAHLVRGVRLDIPGKASRSKFDLLMLDQNYFGFEEYTGVQVDGILSANIFSEFVFRINYQRRVITLFEHKAYHPPKSSKSEKLAVEILSGKPYVQAQLQYRADTSAITAKLLIDTGAGSSLILFHDSDSLVAPPVPNAIKGKFAMGIGGNLEGYIGRMHLLQLGKFEQHNVVNYYQAIDSMEYKTFLHKRKGLIGNQVLSRFIVDFDYTHQQIYLQAGSKYKKPYDYDRSGLSIIAGGRKHQFFYVHAVQPGTGAADAGIQSGDRIMSIHRIPTSLLSIDFVLRKLRRKQAKSVRMVLKRDGKRFKVRVELKDLV
jgi:hypothetical protein